MFYLFLRILKCFYAYSELKILEYYFENMKLTISHYLASINDVLEAILCVFRYMFGITAQKINSDFSY